MACFIDLNNFILKYIYQRIGAKKFKYPIAISKNPVIT